MSGYKTLRGDAPIVIAHRGAGGYRPEHTLEAYSMAIDMGADFIEPDLVITKDGHLIARHDHHLGPSTNVADHPEFAERRSEKQGHEGPDWFVEDFTLAEIKTLKARQAFPGRSTEYDGQFEIVTFEQVLELAQRRSAALGRPIGVYPETKQPTHFARAGLSFQPDLLDTLAKFDGGSTSMPVFIQSFEAGILKELRPQTDLSLIMLVHPTAEGTPSVSVEESAEFANGMGPYKEMLRDPDTGEATDYVARAHALGLQVHPWTFRDDAVGKGFSSVEEELNFYLDQGIDGFFTDFADTGVSVLTAR